MAMGHSKESRTKAVSSLKENASNPEWRKLVSEKTTKRMRDPDVRQRHLKALSEARQTHGCWKAGGNGQPRTQVQIDAEKVLKPLGLTPEFIILTEGHGTIHRPPPHYKADFANPKTRTVLELDGSSHKGREQLDRRKTEVLQALGWKVLRCRHGKEVTPAHLVSVLVSS